MSIAVLVADAGYDSESNHCYAREEQSIRSIIPPNVGAWDSSIYDTNNFEIGNQSIVNISGGVFGADFEAGGGNAATNISGRALPEVTVSEEVTETDMRR